MKGVDVLAELREAADHMKRHAFSTGMSADHIAADAMVEARAAVAELIEAATRANGEHSAPHDCYATGPLTGDPYRDLVSCPGCELSAALARVTGAAA